MRSTKTLQSSTGTTRKRDGKLKPASVVTLTNNVSVGLESPMKNIGTSTTLKMAGAVFAENVFVPNGTKDSAWIMTTPKKKERMVSYVDYFVTPVIQELETLRIVQRTLEGLLNG